MFIVFAAVFAPTPLVFDASDPFNFALLPTLAPTALLTGGATFLAVAVATDEAATAALCATGLETAAAPLGGIVVLVVVILDTLAGGTAVREFVWADGSGCRLNPASDDIPLADDDVVEHDTFDAIAMSQAERLLRRWCTRDPFELVCTGFTKSLLTIIATVLALMFPPARDATGARVDVYLGR